MRTTELLRIRKQNVPVDLALPGSAPREVEIFLPEYGAQPYRRQHVIDLLEESRGFLPARDRASGSWELFNRDSLLWVRVPRGRLGEDEQADEELFDFEKKVRVDLDEGEPLQGELLYSAPGEETRVADYLNQDGRFFSLWQGEHLYLVNKAFVLRVVELG
ncbi:MAG TPA: hypothetical protein VK780_02135 [Thermoanaerobaculia bacterium]|nr:hypothetical protein [Thermoanaerobaculia bacterium]